MDFFTSVQNIHIELKITFVVMCFAVVKALKHIFNDSLYPVLICRGIFFASHAYFGLIWWLANKRLQKSKHLLLEEKVDKRSKITSTLRSILMRAPIVLLLHFQIGLTQPLLVSSLLGLIKLLETECCCYTVTRSFSRKGA